MTGQAVSDLANMAPKRRLSSVLVLLIDSVRAVSIILLFSSRISTRLESIMRTWTGKFSR